MQDIWHEIPMKGSFDPQGVTAHKLRSTGLKDDVEDQEEEQTEDEDLYSGY